MKPYLKAPAGLQDTIGHLNVAVAARLMDELSRVTKGTAAGRAARHLAEGTDIREALNRISQSIDLYD